jgi:hypothetical protein
MPLPIVSWYNETNTTQLTSWPIGTVDAGSVSADLVVLIWNNRAGLEIDGDVSDMQNISITTKNNTGGNTGEIIVDKWIEAKNVSLSEVVFTPIGGTSTHSIRTDESTTNDDGTFTPGIAPHYNPDGSVDILGVWNVWATPADGIANATGNFIKVSLHANVPSDATAGVVNFLTRVAYQYV